MSPSRMDEKSTSGDIHNTSQLACFLMSCTCPRTKKGNRDTLLVVMPSNVRCNVILLHYPGIAFYLVLGVGAAVLIFLLALNTTK